MQSRGIEVKAAFVFVVGAMWAWWLRPLPLLFLAGAVVVVSLSALLPHPPSSKTAVLPRVLGRSVARASGIAFDWSATTLLWEVRCAAPSSDVRLFVNLSFAQPHGVRVWPNGVFRDRVASGHRFAVRVGGRRVRPDVEPVGYDKNSPRLYALPAVAVEGDQWVTVELIKETEATFGVVRVHHVSVETPQCVVRAPKHQRAKRRLLFLGDSLTVGYGVLGTGTCGFAGATESFLHGPIGQFVEGLSGPGQPSLEYQVAAWSGRGLIRNHGDEPSANMSTLWTRALATDASAPWLLRRFDATHAYIWLGANDVSTEPKPTLHAFNASYNALIDALVAAHPQLQAVVCLGGPYSWWARGDYPALSVAHRVLAPNALVHYIPLLGVIPDESYPGQYNGCGAHPNERGSALLAQRLRTHWDSQLASRPSRPVSVAELQKQKQPKRPKAEGMKRP